MTILDNIIFNEEQIKLMLPHRHPLLLVECVHELVLGEKIIASKLLKGNEPVFEGHFPKMPVYPGVYLIESMAQAGAILLFKSNSQFEGSLGLLSGVDEARFRKPCVPGNRLQFEVHMEKFRGVFFWMKGKVLVDGKMVAEAKFSVAIMPNA